MVYLNNSGYYLNNFKTLLHYSTTYLFAAVPSLFLKLSTSVSDITTTTDTLEAPGRSTREERSAKRSQKVVVANILASNTTSAPRLSNIVSVEQDAVEGEPEKSELSLKEKWEKLLKSYQTLKAKHETLKVTSNEQKKELNDTRKTLESTQKMLKVVTTKFENEVAKSYHLETALGVHCLSNKIQYLIFTIYFFAGAIFTKSQKDLIIHKKKKIKWSTEDISRAFTLRYLSKRCYLYLRNTLKYPLPHVSTLVKWASTLNFKQGILTDVIKIMKIAAMNLSHFERVTVVQFDEMKILSTYEYDKSNDEILGPHSQLQVLMVRGLFSKWKQPVYIAFDQKITRELLKETLFHLNGISYEVVACVSDCGGGNVGLWGTLNINEEQTHFLHPCTNEKVYFFADVPHLLKLVRNWLLDTGFLLEEGSLVNKKPLEELVNSNNTEISSCFKLTQKHLDCQQTERQNVALASQLLSHTTATGLIHYQPGADKSLALNTGKFIEIISTWFDIMNSYSASETLHVKKPYGCMLQEQDEHLDITYKTIKGMRCIGKISLLTFQKGILMSITSLKSLFQDMKQKFDCSYILTHRLNQDSLESFFSQIRSRGGLHDHPSPLNAIYRIRMIVLGKNPGVVQEKVNIQTQVETNNPPEEYLLAKVLRDAKLEVAVQKDEVSCLDETQQSSDTSVSSNSSLSSLTENESDGFQYLCGWLARKFKNKHPEMGKYTKDIQAGEHAYQMQPWIQHLSFGGLTEPSSTWYLQARKCEKLFRKYHCGGLKKLNSVKRLTQMAKKQIPNLAEEILRAFFLQRTYIKLKWLNNKKQQLQQQRSGKRKLSTAGDRQKTKKMRKILT